MGKKSWKMGGIYASIRGTKRNEQKTEREREKARNAKKQLN